MIKKRKFTMRMALAMVVMLLSVTLAQVMPVRADDVNEMGSSGRETYVSDVHANLIQEGNYPESVTTDTGENVRSVYYGNASWEQAKAAIVTAAKNISTTADISAYNISVSNLKALFEEAINSGPELFYVANSYGYSYNTSNMVTTVTIKYKYNTSTINTMKQSFDTAVNQAVATIDMSLDNANKALQVHDYLVTHVDYDEQRLLNNTLPDISHSAYGALVNKIAVCDGYSLAYNYILSKVSTIESYVATSNSMNHAWSIIKLDGSYYQVDVTWDDPLIGNNSDYHWEYDNVYHDYFLFSDSGKSDHTGRADIGITCSNTKYDNSVLHNANGMVGISGSNVYFIAYTVTGSTITGSTLYSYNIATNTSTSLKSVTSSTSPMLGSKGMVANGNTLYFCAFQGNNIYSCDLTGNNIKTAYTAERAMQGIGFEGNTLYYCSSQVKYPTTIQKGSTDAALKSSSTYSLDTTNMWITGIKLKTTLAGVISNFDGTVKAFNASGAQITDNTKYLGTGCTIKLYTASGVCSATYTVVVMGDVNGDGTTTVYDMEAIQKQILGISALSGVYKEAGDVDNSNTFSLFDLEKIQKNILGIASL